PLPLTPVKAESVGIGGAGGLFQPAISPHDPDLLFVSCDMGGFYRSQNGGRSWTMLDGHQVQGSPSTRVFFHPTNPSTIYEYGPAPGGNALRVSTDRGTTWALLSAAPAWGGAQVTALEVDPGQPARMSAGTTDGAYFSENSGRSWTKAAGLAGSVVGLFLDPTSPAAARRLFAATPNAVFRSLDGGATWTDTHADLPEFGIRHFTGGASRATGQLALYVTIPSHAVAGHFAGGVYRSVDGRSWTSAMGEGINTRLGKQDEYGIGDIAQYDFVDMAATDPNVVYTSTAGTGYWPPYHFTVFRTADGGRHWNYVFNGDPRFKEKNV
ncbi:MAG: hypothetical protein LC772_09820, partial [Chloroflexi bacterium]|nr:hypothetical protein [Chloroflexota bacterium]